MKRRIKMILIFACIVATSNVFGAYLINVPQKITQPNGKIVNCFATGDEYYNWLHDKDNFTIVLDLKTRYYCYAIIQDNELTASEFVAGVADPITSGLTPGVNLTSAQILNIKFHYLLNTPEPTVLVPESNQTRLKSATTVQTLNNIVIYVRFADQAEFPASQATYSSMFNSATSGANSMYNFFREASYNNLNVVSSFYPTNNGTQILSYRDCHIRDYYRPFSATNDSGYVDNFPIVQQSTEREQNLLRKAINFVNSQIPPSLNVDSNNDGYVDDVCLILRGAYETNNMSLCPHEYIYFQPTIVKINTKTVNEYNIQIEDLCINNNYGVYVLSHEFFHTLGAPELYHEIGTDQTGPIGSWDIMSTAPNPPESTSAFLKFKYGHWISSIPEITQSGHYSLNPVTSPSNNCWRIRSTRTTEYFVVEFRQKIGTFESSIPGTGLLIYRINAQMPECPGPRCREGNYAGPPDEVYVYRPNGTLTNNGDVTNAYFSSLVGRTTFSNTTNPNCFLSDGSLGNVFIKNITVTGNTASFDVRFCDGTDKTISNTNQLPPVTNASNTIVTSGAVTVKSTDNVTFEAAQQITLNGGFEVQLGGQFAINMNGCGGTQ